MISLKQIKTTFVEGDSWTWKKLFYLSLFCHVFCFHVTWWQYFATLTIQCFFSPLFSQREILNFWPLVSVNNPPELTSGSKRAFLCKIAKSSLKGSLKVCRHKKFIGNNLIFSIVHSYGKFTAIPSRFDSNKKCFFVNDISSVTVYLCCMVIMITILLFRIRFYRIWGFKSSNFSFPQITKVAARKIVILKNDIPPKKLSIRLYSCSGDVENALFHLFSRRFVTL